MKPADLKKSIATTAYNIGYSAKYHFATFDIVGKGPGWIGFVSLAVGVLSLIFPVLGMPLVSAVLTISGFASLYISFHDPLKPKYSESGIVLTQSLHDLRALYVRVGAETKDEELNEIESQRRKLEQESVRLSQPKQVFLGSWYAHYKFFWQAQVGWIVEELGLTFWRDKMPLSATVCFAGVVLALVVILVRALMPCLA